jgi:hypothetical protein
VSVPKPEPASATSFATSRSTPFRRSSRRPLRAGLGGEPDEDRPGRRAPCPDGGRCAGEDVLGRLELDGQALLAAQLLRRRTRGRKSATAVAMISIRPVDEVEHRVPHLGGGLDADGQRIVRQRHETLAATSVTRAPRSSAAWARATPILPDERLPMNRTGSIRPCRPR